MQKSMTLSAFLLATLAGAEAPYAPATHFEITGTTASKAAVKQTLTLTDEGAPSVADETIWEYNVVTDGGGNHTQQLFLSHQGKLLTYVDFPASDQEPLTVCLVTLSDPKWKTATGVLLSGKAEELLDIVDFTNVAALDLKNLNTLKNSQGSCTISRK